MVAGLAASRFEPTPTLLFFSPLLFAATFWPAGFVFPLFGFDWLLSAAFLAYLASTAFPTEVDAFFRIGFEAAVDCFFNTMVFEAFKGDFEVDLPTDFPLDAGAGLAASLAFEAPFLSFAAA